MKKLTSVRVRTDGACSNHGESNARAGYGVTIRGGFTCDLSGKVPGVQDSNRAEIYAFLVALRWLEEHKGIIADFRSDSTTLVDGLLGKAPRNNHKDLWQEIELLAPKVEGRVRSIEWLSRDDNCDADALAKQAANAIFVLN